jgi:hypothetical protein
MAQSGGRSLKPLAKFLTIVILAFGVNDLSSSHVQIRLK